MAKDLSGAQVGMSPSNSVNNPRPDNARGRNVFPQSYKHLTTDRYGEYSPFFHVKCERGDVQNLMTKHQLHTFTMKSPMVSDFTMTKSFIKVPMQAIYPRNWEKMMTIPTQGDDVPFDTRALLNPSAIVNSCLDFLRSDQLDFAVRVKAFLLLELIASDGSLFNRFNIHLGYKFTDMDHDISFATIDEIADKYFWPEVVEFGKLHPIIDDNDVYYFVYDSTTSDPQENTVSPRRFIEMIRSNSYTFSDDWLQDYSTGIVDLLNVGGYSFSSNSDLINIEPIISYQLACSQFATNDFVDYIYSAQLYRDNMQALLMYYSSSINTFSYNGVQYLYDVFSLNSFDFLISNFEYDSGSSSPCFDFFINLFSYVPSLRYGDYFTGAKPRPLAVGEYSAEVVDGSVSAIDVTKSIQMQRLLNRVNMVGRKLGDYLAGIFGGSLPSAPKDVPLFLAHQKFTIDGFEVENTGALQFDKDTPNTITSNLRSTDSKHAFEIQIDEPCYIIGMNSYESMRIYSRTIDKFAFHHDRYDDFIPQMQYIGDQSINGVELDSEFPNAPFGYCLRYMEYKQRYSYASGGFINYLPSWAMITDNKEGNIPSRYIDSNYIRSSPSEFDRFYKSLNGYSLGSYFHFIVAHTNISEPIRQMEYTPEILK